MSVAKRHILPFFIPHLGCPNQCIFCDQRRISGKQAAPQPADLQAALQGLPAGGQPPELAFYGGSFTAIPAEQQLGFLRIAAAALKEQKISAIRVSTRPDAIDEEVLARLREFGVGTVELGVQSMSDAVLRLSQRGHTAAASKQALRLLKQHGFITGVQLMPGLPGETADSALAGAAEILTLRPDMLRIYPTVVLAGTVCAELYQVGVYQPLALDAAAELCLKIKLLAEHFGVTVIRIGLQPSEALASDVLAGPYHPAFGAYVQAALWRSKLLLALQSLPDAAECFVNKRDISALIGDKRRNLAFYPHGLRIRGAELPPGALRLREEDGREHLLTDEQFRRLFAVAFFSQDMLK